MWTSVSPWYSGSDMKHLVQEAARAPLRELFQKSNQRGGEGGGGGGATGRVVITNQHSTDVRVSSSSSSALMYEYSHSR